jgi:hypothetical protein
VSLVDCTLEYQIVDRTRGQYESRDTCQTEEDTVKLAVVVIHGMGSQSSAFAEPVKAELSKRIADAGKNPADIAWLPVYWADILEPAQTRYLAAATAVNDLDWMGLRKFIVKALGDASGYQFVGAASSTYVEVHDRIRASIHDLYANELDFSPVPLVVLAHSLGSHIMSSYVWDTQRGNATGADPASSSFERMEWLAGLVTFGSNIPLFTFAYDPVVAISFPGHGLPPELEAKARWLNYFDKDDVLGYPLKPISPSYNEVVDEDIEINVGGFGASLTPLSHGAYWTDDDFTKPVARFLADFL